MLYPYYNSDDPPVPVFEHVVAALSSNSPLKPDKKEIQAQIDLTGAGCTSGENYACAEWVYLRGLINDLSGNKSAAIKDYWFVWKHYPESLYATAARQKLEPVP